MNNLDFSFLFNNRLRFVYDLKNLDLDKLRFDLYNFALLYINNSDTPDGKYFFHYYDGNTLYFIPTEGIVNIAEINRIIGILLDQIEYICTVREDGIDPKELSSEYQYIYITKEDNGLAVTHNKSYSSANKGKINS